VRPSRQEDATSDATPKLQCVHLAKRTRSSASETEDAADGKREGQGRGPHASTLALQCVPSAKRTRSSASETEAETVCRSDHKRHGLHD
jgi:hypothetical protein